MRGLTRKCGRDWRPKVDAELPGIEELIIDDTGFPKKGQHSVGVQRQYSGTLGRQDNCQVATSLHLGGEQGSVCIALRLYLPEQWCSDGERRRKAKVPDDVQFATKHDIALAQLDAALRWGVRKHVVLADAGYGDSTDFREADCQSRSLIRGRRRWRATCLGAMQQASNSAVVE